MKRVIVGLIAFGAAAWAVTGVQVGTSGKTYASASVTCSMHPVNGMSPMVQAGLYNPKKTSTATVLLNSTEVQAVSFYTPDATVWLANGINNIDVALSKRVVDSYQFDASLDYPQQPNTCLPDTRTNTVDTVSGVETAVSGKSSMTITAGCAVNPASGKAQPFVNLFDNGSYLLNVSVNNVALTQLNGSTRRSTPVFLSAGWNVISAANGSLSTDYFVRNGGTGSCTL